MSFELIMVLRFLLIFCIGCIIWAYYIEKTKPKWLKIYEFLYNQLWEFYNNEDKDYSEIWYIQEVVELEFNISKELAFQCILHWREKEWFENNIV